MGVYFNNEQGKWHAKLYHNGKSHHLGYFAHKMDADIAIMVEKAKSKEEQAYTWEDDWNKKAKESLLKISAGAGTLYNYVPPHAKTPSLTVK